MLAQIHTEGKKRRNSFCTLPVIVCGERRLWRRETNTYSKVTRALWEYTLQRLLLFLFKKRNQI